jgi:hypothetical protein
MSDNHSSHADQNHSDAEETYLTQWGTLRDVVARLNRGEDVDADVVEAFEAIDKALEGKKLGKKVSEGGL